MANDMVTRCARAIYEGRNGHGCTPWSRISGAHKAPYLGDARAMLNELREPTPMMLEAVKPWPAHWPKDGPDFGARDAAYRFDQMGAAQMYQAMIDAALSQEDGE